MINILGPTHGNVLPAATLAAMFLVSVSTIFIAKSRAPKDAGVTVDARSRFGIIVQSFGFMFAGLGRPVLSTRIDAPAVAQAALVAGMMTFMITLFWRARTALGNNWSFVARTRDDHGLVTTGPFAVVRHPIYVALFALMIAIATGLSNWDNLVVAIPFFVIGTFMRILPEEKLLRDRFGQAYEDYARRVKRFVPGIL